MEMLSSEKLMSEVQFWRDFIEWWKNKHKQPAPERMLAALADVETRYWRASTAHPPQLVQHTGKYLH
jgi:hypothetical protein